MLILWHLFISFIGTGIQYCFTRNLHMYSPHFYFSYFLRVLTGVLACIFLCMTVDRFGRRGILLLSAILTGLSSLLLLALTQCEFIWRHDTVIKVNWFTWWHYGFSIRMIHSSIWSIFRSAWRAGSGSVCSWSSLVSSFGHAQCVFWQWSHAHCCAVSSSVILYGDSCFIG